MKIVLLSKGNDVYSGEFGNEGSGGQSYLRFNWQADITYKFLTRIKPNTDNSTTFTSYFYDPLTDKWLLIASFKRPQTQTWYTHAHSFLENFDPERGAINRKGFYNNQWACDTEGVWTELTTARFTNDATARKKARMDFMGGVENNQFVLNNCGFFSNYTPLNSVFERKPNRITAESTLGNKPFDEQFGNFDWTMTVVIPVSCFFQHQIKTIKGKTCRANFYKCGDGLTKPHYLSWNNIETPKPDFHTPQYFGEFVFD